MAKDDRRDRGRDRDAPRRDKDRDRVRNKKDRSRSRDRDRDKHRSQRDEPRKNRSRSPSRRTSRSPQRKPPQDRMNGHKRERSALRTDSPPRKVLKGSREATPLKATIRESKADIKPVANGSRKTVAKEGAVNAKFATSESKNTAMKKEDVMDWDPQEDADGAMMRKVMGFGRFRSTKNTKVPGNDWYGVRKEKKIEYRQYMNRVGGFNRPLSPTR